MPTYHAAPTMTCSAPAKSFPRPLEACQFARLAADAFRVGNCVYEVLAGRPKRLAITPEREGGASPWGRENENARRRKEVTAGPAVARRWGRRSSPATLFYRLGPPRNLMWNERHEGGDGHGRQCLAASRTARLPDHDAGNLAPRPDQARS